MKKALFLLFLILYFFVSCSSSRIKPDDGVYELKIFETTDIHGSLFDIGNGEVFYSMAYISDKVNDYRNDDGSNVILLDSGDLYQGNSYSTLIQGESIAAMLDIMKYDAVSVGNHEFDWGSAEIKKFVDGNEERTKLSEFNSNNTDLLTVEEVKEKLMQLDYVKQELADWRK